MQVLSEVKFMEPRMPVISNVNAQPLSAAADIPTMLARQLVEPVILSRNTGQDLA